MPQKRNPISCLYIHSTVALVRQHVAALLEAAVADHERSTGPWEIEWISLPEIFLLTSGALAQTRLMLCGLEVDADRMRASLDLTRGMIVSEAVMMGLAPHLGRQRAHDLVYDICRKVGRAGSRWSICWRRMPISRGISRTRSSRRRATPPPISGSPARWWTRCWRAKAAASVDIGRRAFSPKRAAKCRGSSWQNDSTSDFRVASARVIVAAKDQEGTHADDIACRRIRGGARLRQLRVRHWRAGARIPDASHHHDRAVPCGRPDRHARADFERRHADVAQPAHHRGECDRCRVDHRGRPRRPGGARRLHAYPRQLDQLCGVRRALPYVIRPIDGF